MQLSTDQEAIHTVVDAKENEPQRSMTIQPDRHGLTIKFEGNEDSCLIIDLYRGVFTLYFYDEDEREGAEVKEELCTF